MAVPGDSDPQETFTRRLALAAFTGVIACAFLAWRLRSGISLTPDSLSYLFAARSLVAHGELSALGGPPGAPLTVFPPLYPALIAVTSLFVPGVESAAAAVNVACLFSATCCAFLLLRAAGVGPWTGAAATLAVFLHPRVQQIFWFAWSEAAYTALALLLLAVFAHERKAPRRLGAVAGCIAAFAFLARYAGVSLMAVPIAGALSQRWRASERVRCAAIAVAVQAAVILAWVLRNESVDATAFGPRPGPGDPLQFALGRVLAATGEWVAPASRFASAWPLIGAVAIAVFVAALIRKRRSIARTPGWILPAVVLGAAHTALMIYSQTATVLDPLDPRLLAPALIPATLAFVAVVVPSVRQRALPAAMLMTAAMAMAALTTHQMQRVPHGFEGWTLRPAEVPAACRAPSTPWYSDQPELLRYLDIAPDARPLPRRVPYRQKEPARDWDAFRASLKAHDACLAWFLPFPPAPGDLLGGGADDIRITALGQVRDIRFFLAATHD